MDLATFSDSFQSVLDKVSENRAAAAAVGIVGGVVLISGVAFLLQSGSGHKSKPGSTDIAAGTIDKKEIRKAFVDYSNIFDVNNNDGQNNGDQKTEGMVDTFYNLVTDFYEWGWGEGFHFDIPLPGKVPAACAVVTETRVGILCDIGPGNKALDCGCGVGGPMRTIASLTGAEVTGITINRYQVDRANYHNKRYGLDSLCNAVQGNFHNLPFLDNSFDAAYAIEATCHSRNIENVYIELFRVIKPGGRFVSIEWVKTPKYDPNNPKHVKALEDICYGNGLPMIRSAEECIQAAKKIGFEVLKQCDLTEQSTVCKPWYDRLEKMVSGGFNINRTIVNVLSFLHLLPSGVKQVHDMLIDAAGQGLVTAGKEGVFTPMHLLVLKKPEMA